MDHRPIKSFVSTGIAEADVGAVGSSGFRFVVFWFHDDSRILWRGKRGVGKVFGINVKGAVTGGSARRIYGPLMGADAR